MQDFTTALAMQFSIQTLFSMLGALVGSLISADVKRYGWRLTILFTIVASVVGGAISDYLVHQKGIVQIWILFALNVPTGMVVGTTLDVIRIASPKMIEKLINSVGNSTVDIVSNAVKNRLENTIGSSNNPTKDNS